MSKEQITILHTTGARRAHKIFVSGEDTRDYDAGWQFTVDTREVENLEEFAKLLEVLEQDSTAFIIRGKPKPDVTCNLLRRRKCLGADAAFDACPKRLFCVDIDNVEAPTGVDPCSIAAIDHAISLLPAECHDADVVAQFSNSAGTTAAGDKIKLHLWFWGAREYADVDLKRWAKASAIADPALYQAVQPHYTARPQFVGTADPLEDKPRIVFVKKAKSDVAITLPQLASYSTPPRQMPEQAIAELARNGKGKIIDGRERLLCGIRWKVLFRNHVTTLNDFYEHVLASFTEQAELGATPESANVYDAESIFQLCERDWTNHGALIPEAPRPTLSAQQAVAKLTSTLKEALRSKGAVAVKATAGLGKSRIAAEELVALPGISNLHVDVYVPSKKEQRQWQATLISAAQRASVPVDILLIEGRNEENCVQHEAASVLSKAGLSPTKLLCRTKDAECKAYQNCLYRAQFVSKGPAIRIFTHSHLATPVPDGFPTADLVVIDESFHNVAVRIEEKIPIADIRGLRGVDLNRLRAFANASETPTSWKGLFSEAFTVCRSIAETISSNNQLLDEIRGRGISAETLRSVAELILGSLKYPSIAPNAPLQQVNAEVYRCERKRATSIALTLQVLATELETRRSASHAIKTTDNHTFTLCSRKKLPRLCDVETIIILDADSDENNLRPLLPQLQTVSIEAQLNAKVTQIENLSFSRQHLRIREDQQLNEDAVMGLVRHVRQWRGQRKLVATYQALIPHLAPHLPGVKFCYFGNLRGTNDFEDCDTVFVIGRQFIPSDAVENIARALHWDSREPLLFGPPIPRRYQAGLGVLRSYDELDPRGQSVRVSSREAETRQALARVRLVHAAERKEVVLLSSQPSGVPVDALIQFEPSRAERILAKLDGILPLAAEELAGVGDEFKDSKAAKRWRDRPEYTPVAIRDTFRRAGVVLAPTSYRHKGQRGPRSNMLVDPLRHPMPQLTAPKLLAACGRDVADVAPLDWVCEPMPGLAGVEICRLRKPADKEGQ